MLQFNMYLFSFLVDLNIEHTVVLQFVLPVEPFSLDEGAVSTDDLAVRKIRVEKLGKNTADDPQSHQSAKPDIDEFHHWKKVHSIYVRRF